jgi:broad specificity phosphatase PhoE
MNQKATRISLVRHGHVNNPDDIFYGRLPGFKLDSNGRLEAVRTAEALTNKKIDGVYSSPMLRARQTANEILKIHPRLKSKISSLITEVFSPFEGQPNKILALCSGDVYAGKDPIYEQPEDVIRRTQRFIRRIRKRHFGRHLAAVTHGDVILFAIFQAKNITVTASNKLNLDKLCIVKGYPATGSITTLTYQTNDMDEIPEVSYFDPGTASCSIKKKFSPDETPPRK